MATLQLLILFLFFSFFSFHAVKQALLPFADLHMQLCEEAGAAAGESGKKTSNVCFLITLIQFQLTSFNEEINSV